MALIKSCLKETSGVGSFISVAKEDAGYFSAISNIGSTPLAEAHNANTTGTYESYSWDRTGSDGALSLTVPVSGTYYTLDSVGAYVTNHVNANATISGYYVITFIPD